MPEVLNVKRRKPNCIQMGHYYLVNKYPIAFFSANLLPLVKVHQCDVYILFFLLFSLLKST